jgi:hypothetical protein
LRRGLAEKLFSAEEELYAAPASLGWGLPEMEKAAIQAGLEEVQVFAEYYEEERLVSRENIAAWFGPVWEKAGAPPEGGGSVNYAALLGPRLDAGEAAELKKWLEEKVAGAVLPWKSCTVFASGKG